MIAPLLMSQVTEFIRASLPAQLHGGDVAFTRVTTDSRQIQPGDLFLALRGERFDGHEFLAAAATAGACGLVVEQRNPDIALPQLVVRDSLLALGQIAALNRAAFHGPLMAITGSSGKTTVKTMIANILRECGSVLMTQGNFNNHIGVPLTLLQIDSQHEYAVIEMGASAEREIAYLCELAQPDIALINNVMPAHIEGFGSIEGIARAKGEIYQGLVAGGTAIVNLDDVFAAQWLAQLSNKKVQTVALSNEAANCFARDLQHTADGVRFTLVLQQQTINIELAASGEHSVRNALMAATCAAAAGATLAQIKKGLAGFAPVAGRMSRHVAPGGAVIIDDSYNANPGSVRAAIDVLAIEKMHTILVLGDMGELGEQAQALHADVGGYAKARGVNQLLSVGTLSRNASEAFGENAQHFATQAELIQHLKDEATNNKLILIKGSRSAKMDVVVRELCAASSDSTGEQH
jgi:UDP-N-acetylmuramoyl-tripeptide--D-alanyl-D-alanine ligase